MKHIIIIINIILFISCTNDNKTLDIAAHETIPWDYATKFHYKDHDYIKFASGYAGGVVHDPDCKCFKDSINK